MTWNDISIWKFLKIQEIMNDQYIDDEERTMQLIQLIYEVNPYKMRLQDFLQYQNSLDFMRQELKKNKLQSEYEINGQTYVLTTDIAGINVTQYCDYVNYIKDDPGAENFYQILSVFLIPKGRQYNDGYDMNKTKTDIESHLGICDAMAMSDFFLRYFQNYTTILGQYFKHLMRWNRKMTRKQKRALIKEIDNLINTAYYH